MSVLKLEVPHTYSEWVTILDIVKDRLDDQQALEVMLKGTVEWQSGVAERFTRKLIDVINERIDSATDNFQKEIGRAHGQESALVQSLLKLRKELYFLVQITKLPTLPEETQKDYSQLVITQADKIQASLEDSAKSDRSGKLISIIRNNKVNRI